MSRINDFEKIPEPQGSHFAAFDELVVSEPYTIEVSQEAYDQIVKALNEPPKVNERLKRLLRDKK
jgi:uncharacterized protein (DUF1778 family)